MPLNKVDLYIQSVRRNRTRERKEVLLDMVAAISGSLGGKGLSKYIKELEE